MGRRKETSGLPPHCMECGRLVREAKLEDGTRIVVDLEPADDGIYHLDPGSTPPRARRATPPGVHASQPLDFRPRYHRHECTA